MNDKICYTSNELLEIFKEQHRLSGQFDFMVDGTFVLTKYTLIREWREVQDLLPWKELSKFLNQEFRIDVPIKIWDTIFNPDDKKTLGDLCDFLSTVAEKEIVKPIKILGSECLTFSVFQTLKRNLKIKGVDVVSLKPSTRIEDFLAINDNFSPLLEEVTLTGVKVFDKFDVKVERERCLDHWLDRIFPNWKYESTITTGDIETFRDLVNKIVENKKLGTDIVKI